MLENLVAFLGIAGRLKTAVILLIFRVLRSVEKAVAVLAGHTWYAYREEYGVERAYWGARQSSIAISGR
jgi:hypothetical protein